MSSQASEKLHAVCIPYPAQGHVNPMLKLAKILHYRGYHITFVNTEYNHERLLRSRGPNSLDGLPSFRFKSIPDGLPPTDVNVTQDVPTLCGSIRKNFLAPFRSLLSELNSSPNSPPVTCIISDVGMIFSLDAAHELGLPVVLFHTASASAFMCYLHYAHLIEKGIAPLKDASYLTNGYLDTLIDWIPGLSSIRLREMPTFIRTTDRDDVMLNYLLEMTNQAQRASAIIMNTFDALEYKVLDAFSSFLPPVFSIGPLHQLLSHIQEEDDSKTIGSNLWKEEPECLEWLESKEPNSVVYVNFGSITVMTDEQLDEFAWGLANSNMNFLWVIRPDLVAGKSAVVPPEFVEETKGRSCFSSWCPQEQVLNHPAIGGFLTHCGWNSTIESLCGGVPMICWPFFADQQTNCRFCCKEWGVAMEIDGDVKRDYIEDLVRKLMGGNGGKKMRKKALEWKNLAEEAITAPNGSSFLNMGKMVNQVLLPPKY